MKEGRIIKALSGFYYVLSGDELIECKGRGLFRMQKITPLVGDRVKVEVQADGKGTIVSVDERVNELIRPPVANIDQAIIVNSLAEPDFSPLLLDRFLVLIEHKEIKPLIILTKTDLVKESKQESIEQYMSDYRSLGYDLLAFSKNDPANTIYEAIQPYLADKISVIAGQSGVGKSTLLNVLDLSLQLETGDISKSLGRGKHTTRHVELYSIAGGLIADTPGFSSLEFSEIELDELRYCFPEFVELQDHCKFRGCMHMKEPKCAVKAAVDAGDIPAFRYKHYKTFYEEINSRKPRY
ncbi:ribosome small subunit-dependent GTPase A [Allobacillus halotolerans]|uniref:Small ribosomal subunit biogenesis GTPase RsgA n=1 Tax=Allobacillus halotolerans TaxID=570278 RepID=A0ABS6GQX7_9BACI|nr:ribosome small subunit-dependent GTPase A [Allobacillus halotolerans]MBU6081348.1 ribosome small subunit-dependent GTPase A [Allobacillus halotolerans]